MKLTRRKLMHLAAGAAALPVLPRSALALDYPTRPVRIIVGFAAGGPQDTTARIMARWLSEKLGKPFFVENHPGAGSNLAAEAAARAAPDGYTLLLVGAPNAINATLYTNLSFNFIRDIAPIAGIMRAPLVMVTNPLVPAKTVREFITYARTNPGKITMASSGNGTPGHVAGELFKMMTDVNMVHVPYRGEVPALTDLLAGQVQVMFGGLAPTIGHIRAGKLRALAVTTQVRSNVLSDIPTLGEFVAGYEASGWNGIGAPRDTSRDIVDALNKTINAGLVDPEIKARIAGLGGIVLAGSPDDFGKLIADETEKWGQVIRTAKIKAE